MNRGRLIAWTMLVAAIAALNYAARFTNSSASKSARDVVYSYSTFAGGMVLYAVWVGIVILIATTVLRPARAAVAALVAARPRLRRSGRSSRIYVCEAVVSLIPLPQSPGKEQGLTPTHWESAHAGAFAANLVLFALVAPFVEELTFRGLGQSLLMFLGRWPSIVLVGFAFGFAHGLLEALFVLVPFGIILAYLRDRTDSVYPGMIVHGLFNAVALTAAVLG